MKINTQYYIKKIIFEFSSTTRQLLIAYMLFLKKFLIVLNIAHFLIALPAKQKLKTFLKSPHVNKRAKENFIFTVFRYKISVPFNAASIKAIRYNVPKNIHLKIIYNN